MLRVSILPMFGFQPSAFGGNAQQFGYLLLRTVATKLTLTSLVCFIQATECSAGDLFLSARL